MGFVFQINIACRKTRLESLSLAENCFASPRKYHENGNRFFRELRARLEQIIWYPLLFQLFPRH